MNRSLIKIVTALILVSFLKFTLIIHVYINKTISKKQDNYFYILWMLVLKYIDNK